MDIPQVFCRQKFAYDKQTFIHKYIPKFQTFLRSLVIKRRYFMKIFKIKFFMEHSTQLGNCEVYFWRDFLATLLGYFRKYLSKDFMIINGGFFLKYFVNDFLIFEEIMS